MVMSAYFKSIFRSFRKNTGKLISLTAVMLLAIAFVAGLGTLSPSVKDSLSAEMNAQNVADITLKPLSAEGFTAEQFEEVAQSQYVSAAEKASVIEVDDGGVNTRIYVYDSFNTEINRLTVTEGRLPEKAGEILAERENNGTQALSVGDTVTVLGKTYTVVGIAANPLIFDRLGEPSSDGETLGRIVYFCSEFSAFPFPVTDIYIRLDGLENRDFFSDGYLEYAASRAELLQSEAGESTVALTLKENKSYMTADSYCEKVSAIAFVFPAFFILVAALVVMTTMTRMIEEERAMIGCVLSLGSGDGKIMFKYLFMASGCCIAAAAAGFAAGLTVLPAVILPAFDSVFFMPALTGRVYPLLGIVSFAAMAAVVLTVTAVVCKGRLKEQPANLLIAKAPKPGKKIFLERIGFFWKRLSFKYKSSIRNIFRYKKHLAMTIVSVAGATALVFAGFVLLNVANSMHSGSFVGFEDSLKPISVAIIIFALLLCGFVIYNLTNMNIGERKREIATLDVLGYRKSEILGYIYREIMLMVAFGALVGVGLGCILVQAVLSYLDFGSLADAEWYSYIASFALVLVFAGGTDLLLSQKILGIDMASSLKAND